MASSSSSSPEISGASSRDHFSYKHATHDEVLEDLSSRFILNLPDDELSSLERICFQVEQAHWFYEDFIREENPNFPSLPLKRFSAMLFHACPLLHQWSHDHEQAFNTFMQYKTRVPVCGAIMLNDTWEKCLLVKGWKSSSGWGFPKGKINEVEPPANCAIREVLEETGYNLAGQIDPENVIEMSIKEQKLSLFIVPGVPEDYPFKTKTRKEISKIEWFRLTDLPTWKRNKAAPGRFYLISPFIGPLKAFINERKPRNTPKKALKAKKPPPNQERKDSSHAIYNETRHESSSQSSSAENGEPQTPSPYYAESHANGVPQVIDAEPLNSDQAVTTMDPHFAQLLSALALSASSTTTLPCTNDGEKHTLVPSSTWTDQYGSQRSSTPVPATALSIISRTSADRPEDENLSASAPQYHQTSPSEWTHPLNTQSFDTTPAHPPPISLPQTNQKRPASPMLDNGEPNYYRHLPHARTPPLLNAAASPTNTIVPSRLITSPRARNSADISPYLSRPAVLPTPSPERLKHIALLEAVSAESARLMQAYKIAAANGVPANVSDNFKHPMTHVLSTPSVPTSTSPKMNLDNQPPLYSTGTLHSMGFASTAPMSGDGTTRDTFQGRSKTSLSSHRSSVANLNPPRNASMNQAQLLALMNGPPQVSHPGIQPSQIQSISHPLSYTPSPRDVNLTTVQQIGVPYNPSLGLFPRTPGPCIPRSPTNVSLQSPPYPSNNTLLSILNGSRGVSRVSNAASHPPLSSSYT